MAYKDEYEVARLYTDGTFSEAGRNRLRTRRAALRIPSRAAAARAHRQGHRRAAQDELRALDHDGLRTARRLKGLRGTAFDPFGYTAERRTERRLIAEYEGLMTEVLGKLNADNHPLAVGLAVIPEKIRGFGHVKLRNLKAAKADEAALLEQFRSGAAPMLKAAE